MSEAPLRILKENANGCQRPEDHVAPSIVELHGARR